jgi:prephenate dehydrogenase
MGGSLGLALRQALPELEIRGYDVDGAALAGALDRGAITAAAADPADAVKGAAVVVLGVPLDVAPELLALVAAVASDEAIVTDLGSAKALVVEEGRRHFGDRFVGGHPMAGSERHGIEAAEADLYQDAWWIVTPTTETSAEAYRTIADMAGLVGATAVALDPSTHDALVARLSHLPQLVASALVDVAASSGDREAVLGLAGAGFRDVTRIAASNPDLWVTIVSANEGAVLEAIGGLRTRLAKLEEDIGAGRWEELRGWLAQARAARLELFAKPEYGDEPVALSLLIPDRPGVLAEVTTAAGELGANIEDLRIMHSTEGGQGRLELIVAGRQPAELLAGALMELGYTVHRTQIN